MSILDTLNFKNLAIGDPQTDSEMTVIPIVGPSREDFAEPEALQFRQTTSYGTMVFENRASNPAIIPAHTMARGRGAQDHAMSGAGIVPANKSKSFENACCIEESQGGYLRGAEEMDVLPASLRKTFLSKTTRSQRSYNKLWGRIKEWLRGIPGITGRGAHLRYFYDNKEYRQALENFAASFEPIEGQIGAFILFEGVPVGLEIMPSASHWNKYWKQLIRGCYGAELIRLRKTGRINESSLILPTIPENADEDQVAEILDTFVTNVKESIIPLLQAVEVTKRDALTSGTAQIGMELIHTNSGGGGDLVTKDGDPVYLSIVL